MSEKEILLLIQHLKDVWKRHFGMFTQYIGYLSPNQLKTLFVLKRISDENGEFDISTLDLCGLNNKAREYDVAEFGYKKELDSVLPFLHKELKRYNLGNIEEGMWRSLLGYLDFRQQ